MIIENKLFEVDKNSEAVFSIIASFTPNADLAPIVFSRKALIEGEDEKILFKRQLREGHVKRVMPRIYSRRRVYMPFDTEPMAYAVAWALSVEHGWRVALPAEIAGFLLGNRERPQEHEVRVFVYDQPAALEYERFGFRFEPAKDMSLFDLTVAGQAIRLGREKADDDMNEIVKLARFAANSWFREEKMLTMLAQDLELGTLDGYDQLLALAIREEITNPLEISRVSPRNFDPADHKVSAMVKGWWVEKLRDGSEYLASRQIFGHPYINDGERLARSTNLIWIDEKLGWARTRSRIYRLLEKD